MISDVYIFIGSYLLVLIGLLVLIQVLTNGFLFTFLRVKASRGKKVLVNVRGVMQHYYITGVEEEGFLVYRDNACKRDGRKTIKRVVIHQGMNPFYRNLNVNCVNVDEQRNCIIYPDSLKGVMGYDAIKWSNLLLRAQMKMKLTEEPVIGIITMVGVILLILLTIYGLVQLNAIKTAIELLQSNTVITGGNIG